MTDSLKDRNAVVTGGAGGIGRQIWLALVSVPPFNPVVKNRAILRL